MDFKRQVRGVWADPIRRQTRRALAAAMLMP